MRDTLSACIIFTLYMLPSLGAAYEPDTHQRLSDSALKQSVLVAPSCNECTTILGDLGLKAYNIQIFPNPQDNETIYLDPGKQIQFKANSSGSIEYLITAGAALEDENPRALFHFYDPVQDHTSSLHIGGVAVPYSAPDWALADLSLPLGQVYSVKNANDYFYKALTSISENDRNQAFGSLFVTLGHVIHLVQDMAQPQHVRNDMHCDDIDICLGGELFLKLTFGKDVPLYNPSLYESYTYDHANVAGYAAGYAPVNLPTARSYWADSSNKGLAQFTNENFVSAETNFNLDSKGDVLPNGLYALPSPISLSNLVPIDAVYKELGQSSAPQQIRDHCAKFDTSYCGVSFVATQVADNYAGTNEVNGRAATYSIWDPDFEHYASQRLFTLNTLNFQYDWQYLLSRAVSYSAGLINHVFRGSLDIKPDPNNPGGYLIINKSNYPMSGTLVLYYDDSNGNRYPVPGASWSNVNLTVSGDDPADKYSILFSAPADPVPANPGQYMLVFQGKIGTENGVTGKSFSTTPTYLYFYSAMPNVYTLWTVPDNAALDLNSLVAISSESVNFGHYLDGFAVYGGNIYTAYNEIPLLHCTGRTTKNIAFVNYQPFVTVTNMCNAPAESFYEGGAVNTKYVYLYQATFTAFGAIGNIEVYDHDGNYVTTISNTPTQTVSHFAVNDSRMCLSGFADGNLVPKEILTDLDGNIVTSFPGDPFLGGHPCALTKDRLYIVAVPLEGDAFLDVYDLNGNQIASLDVTNSAVVDGMALVTGVTATNSNIYISEGCYGECPADSNKIMVFSRIVTRTADGKITSEEFVRQPDFMLPGPNLGFDIDFLAVDMKDILGGSGS